MSKHHRMWEEDEVIYLEYFIYNNDTELKEAAEFLNRPLSSINDKLFKLRKENKKLPLIYRRWTEKEDCFLKTFHASMTMKHIGIRLQRTPSAIRTRANQLGLSKTIKISNYDKEIRKMIDDGLYQIDICRKFKTSYNGLNCYLKKNGIAYNVMPLSERATLSGWREINYGRGLK